MSADGNPLRLDDIVRNAESARQRFKRDREKAGGAKADSPRSTSAWKLERLGDLLKAPVLPDWLVRGILEKKTTACFFGAPGCGKSFLAVDLACSVATGQAWHSHAATAGPVAYLTGEGRSGLLRRFYAWCTEHGVDAGTVPLHLSSQAIDLTGKRDEIINAVRLVCGDTSPALVIVDTMSRHLPLGANENSGEDVGPFLAAADSIQHAFSCCVLLVHHTGHVGDRERGWSGMRGAFDWSYHVQKGDKGPVILTCRKAKDFDEPEPMHFSLCGVDLPGWTDDIGEKVTSAVLRPTGATEAGMGANQMLAMMALKKLIYAAKGEPVTVSDWRKASGLDRFRWRDTFTSLTERGLVVVEGAHAHLV